MRAGIPPWVCRRACIPPYMPPRPPFVGVHASSLLPVYTLPGPVLHRVVYGNYTFNTEVEEERPPWVRNLPSSAENKPPFLAETGLKRHRNPLQKGPLHKETKNMPTPLKVASRPPQGPEPPFNSEGKPPSWAQSSSHF